MAASLPWSPSEMCARCGAATTVDPDRGRFALRDEAESTVGVASGNLCDGCYQQFIGEVA